MNYEIVIYWASSITYASKNAKTNIWGALMPVRLIKQASQIHISAIFVFALFKAFAPNILLADN